MIRTVVTIATAGYLQREIRRHVTSCIISGPVRSSAMLLSLLLLLLLLTWLQVLDDDVSDCCSASERSATARSDVRADNAGRLSNDPGFAHPARLANPVRPRPLEWLNCHKICTINCACKGWAVWLPPIANTALRGTTLTASKQLPM